MPLLAILLAFFAVVSIHAGSALHNALPHDVDHVASFDGSSDHSQGQDNDADGDAHQSLHEIVQGTHLLPAHSNVTSVDLTDQLWAEPSVPVLVSIAPSSLLRPPQA